MKPVAPPPGIIDLDNQDEFKTDEGDIQKPVSSPPPGFPSTPAPKPNLNGLGPDNADASGELIE
jgi:hypothetical protein